MCHPRSQHWFLTSLAKWKNIFFWYFLLTLINWKYFWKFEHRNSTFAYAEECLTKTALVVSYLVLGIHLILSLLIISSNLIIICTYLRNKRLQSSYVFWFKISISTADLLVGLGLLPMVMAYHVRKFFNNYWVGQEIIFKVSLLCTISISETTK